MSIRRSDRATAGWTALGSVLILTLAGLLSGSNHPSTTVAPVSTAEPATAGSPTGTWKPGDPVPGDPANNVVPGQANAQLSGGNSDAGYLQYMHQSQYGTGATDDVLISDAHKVCTAFDSQKTLDQVFDMNDFSSLNSWQRGTMIGDAVASYCPQFSQTVVAQFESQGGGGGDQTYYPPTAGGQGLPGGDALTYGTYRAGRRAWGFARHFHW